MTPMVLPDPMITPLLRPDQLVGLIPGMRRSAIYDAVKRGDLPSIRIGRRLLIPTAELRRRWQLDADAAEPTTVVSA